MRTATFVSAAILLLVFLPVAAFAQGGGNQGGGNQGGGNQGGGNQGQFPGGILIRPSGLIDQAVITPGAGTALQKQLRMAAQRTLAADLNRPSELRKVSLRDLVAEIARRFAAGEPLSSDIRFLAGLTRIDFVFVTDEGQDVVIAGPAEGFASIAGGRCVGVESGRPVLCLDDLLVALRDPVERRSGVRGSGGRGAIGCSIDPDPQRLSESMRWLKQNSSPATIDVARARLQRMVAMQGLWNVTTFGVPEDSRMAVAMVEADYLMKRLAIGVDNPGVKGLKSSLALAAPGDNMMRRWWFAPRYDSIERNADATAWHLSGPRLQLFAQEELMDAGGNLIDANSVQGSSEKFAVLFNDRIEPLVQRILAFADLQNIFDILVAASIIRDSQQRETLHWKPDFLTDEAKIATTSYTTPRETSPMLNVRSSGASLIIGAFTGGVSFRPDRLLRQIRETTDEEQAKQLQPPARPTALVTHWWWD
jgi:hypothetical protein